MKTETNFKRILSILLCCAMLAGLMPITVFAVSYSGSCGAEGDNVTWSLDTATGVLTISGAGTMENYASYRKSPWNQYSARITSVEISDGVTSIGEYAFAGCSRLTSITLPDSVTSIGKFAFSDCTSLTSVTIGNSVTSIAVYAFDNCSSLTSIEIPDSVTSIGHSVFRNCSSLTSVTIGDGVTSIGSGAFRGCKITDFNISSGNTAFTCVDGVVYDKALSSIIVVLDNTETVNIPATVTDIDTIFCDNTTIREVSFAEGSQLTSIGEEAFRGCSSLTSITIPNGVTSIGKLAFFDCNSLTSIMIPDSVTTIDDEAFSKCGGLTSVIIGNGVTSIGSGAFRGCSSLTSITIPNSVTSIGLGAFEYCSGLVNINIPDGVTSIESCMFIDCSSLVSVTIGESSQLTCIRNDAFNGCSSLSSITIPGGVTSIDSNAFHGCKIADFKISPENTSFTYLDGAVYDKDITSLLFVLDDTVNIPATVTNVDYYAFHENSIIREVSFADGSQIESISEKAFSGCSSLTSITIPDSVKSIDYDAFSGCSSLTSITIPDGVTEIKWRAFSNCSSLTEFDVAAENPSYCDIDGVLMSKDGTELVCYPGGKQGSYAVPDSVTSIGYRAFAYCDGLTSITIPNSVTSIGTGAFEGCDNITIYGNGGSYAQTYAKENGIPFQIPINFTAPEDNFGGADIASTDEELKNAVLTGDDLALLESGTPVKVFVEVVEVKDAQDTVSAGDLERIEAALNGYTAGLYLDINLYKQVGENAATKIPEANGKIKIAITIPDALIANGRTYKVIRVHDGAAQVIDGEFNSETNVFTFETDRFSTYSIVYADGVTVSGTVICYGDKTENVTIELWQDGKASYSVTVSGNNAAYSIEAVAAGTYTVKVMKQNHVTREYTITVGDTAVTQDVKIHLLGDINGDGKVTTVDYIRAYSYAKGSASLSEYELKCADTVKQDGTVTTADAVRIYAHAKGTASLW